MRPAVPLALLLATAACSDVGRGHGGHGVLVIVVDALRADHVGVSGYDRDTTPVLDGLAADGVYFAQTFSAGPHVMPAHAALLTGSDPLIARRPPLPDGTPQALVNNWYVPDAAPRLAVEYLAHGYATAAFVDHPWLSPLFGFDRGFEEFHGFSAGTTGNVPNFGIEGVATRFLGWIRSLDRDRDWFAYLDLGDLDRSWRETDPRWVSYFEPRPELALVPPVCEGGSAFFALRREVWEETGSRSLGEYEAAYDGSLRRLDGLIKRLLTQLRQRGRWEETTVCVIGSYGLGFGESGLILASGTLSDVDLHVPWIVRPAASIECARGTVARELASSIDLAPTLLELSGLGPPAGMHGVSQVAVLRGAAQPARELAFARGGEVHTGFAVRDARYSFERISPGAAGSGALATSWFGDRRPQEEPWREHLRDRLSGAGPGDLEPSAVAPEVAARLRAAGEDWYGWIEAARDAYHDVPWRAAPIDHETRAELVRRGLLGAIP